MSSSSLVIDGNGDVEIANFASSPFHQPLPLAPSPSHHHRPQWLSLSLSPRRSVSCLSDALFSALQRRGYAASVSVSRIPLSSGGGSGVGKLEDASAMATKQDSSEASSAWVPDPVTGYYRPINNSPEFRLMLLNHKVR